MRGRLVKWKAPEHWYSCNVTVSEQQMLSEQTTYSPSLFFLTKQIEPEQYENNQMKLVFVVGPTCLCLWYQAKKTSIKVNLHLLRSL